MGVLLHRVGVALPAMAACRDGGPKDGGPADGASRLSPCCQGVRVDQPPPLCPPLHTPQL